MLRPMRGMNWAGPNEGYRVGQLRRVECNPEALVRSSVIMYKQKDSMLDGPISA